MSGTCDQAQRYRERAEECLQIVATSQTPGTGEIYLLIAHHYLLLVAAAQKGHASGTARATMRQSQITVHSVAA
jgi:hypothetical protein